MRYMQRFTLFLFLILLTSCQDTIIGLAESTLYPIESVNEKEVPETPPVGFEQIYLPAIASDGSEINIHTWYKSNASQNVLIYAHGNGMHLGRLDSSGLLEMMNDLGANLIAFDYPAYGKSSGSPNEVNLLASAQATLDFAKAKFPNAKIFFWGRSLGAAVATGLVSRNQNSISGMILTSPWADFYSLAVDKNSLAKQLPDSWKEKHTYDSVKNVGQMHVRTLIQHGNKDEVITDKFGKKVYAAFPESTDVAWLELDGYGHNDVFNEPLLWQSIQDFINE